MLKPTITFCYTRIAFYLKQSIEIFELIFTFKTIYVKAAKCGYHGRRGEKHNRWDQMQRTSSQAGCNENQSRHRFPTHHPPSSPFAKAPKTTIILEYFDYISL